jgi:hypothetical protein
MDPPSGFSNRVQTKKKKENLNVDNFGILWGWGKFGI